MKIAIMGCGRTGSILALLMSQAGHEVTMIERSPDALQRLGKQPPCRIVLGDGLDEDTLREAELETMDAFVACTSGDNTNLMVVNDPVRAEAYRQYGIFTLTSGSILAGYLRDWLTGQSPRCVEEYNQLYPELNLLLQD